MASPQRAPGSQPFDQSILDELVDTESESGSSYVGSDESIARPSICPWRNSSFHDRECARYFDCPSHIVERRLSVDGSEEDEAVHSNDNEDDDSHHHHSNHQSLDAQENPDLYTSSPRPASTDDQEVPPLSRAEQTELSTSTQNPTAATETTSHSETRPEAQESDYPPDETGDGSQGRSTNNGAGLQVATSYETERPTTDTELDNQDRTDPPERLPFRYLPVSREIMEDLFQSPGNDNTEHGLPPLPRPPDLEGGRRTSDIQLPRWQPDAEITYCPICHTQFSFFVRKHHCR